MSNRLSHTDPVFHIAAPANSPLWGSAEDLTAWIREWGRSGCPTKANEERREAVKQAASIRIAERQEYSNAKAVAKRKNKPVQSIDEIIDECMEILHRHMAGESLEELGPNSKRMIAQAKRYIYKMYKSNEKLGKMSLRFDLTVAQIMVIVSELEVAYE